MISCSGHLESGRLHRLTRSRWTSWTWRVAPSGHTNQQHISQRRVWFIATLSFILISNKQRIYQSLICTKIPEQDTTWIQKRQWSEATGGGAVGWRWFDFLSLNSLLDLKTSTCQLQQHECFCSSRPLSWETEQRLDGPKGSCCFVGADRMWSINSALWSAYRHTKG